MKIDITQNLEESNKRFVEMQDVLAKRYLQAVELEKKHPDQAFTVSGFSVTADQQVEFAVDWLYSDGKNINWRERLVCPVTGLCNRFRASYHLMKEHLKVRPEEVIYMTEQVTPLFQFLSTKYENLMGSEYINPNLKSGQINEQGIRHEDLTSLSFDNSSLDKVFSFDCLEHIVEYKKALKECLRVLKPGGQILMSFPFSKSEYKTLIRAIVTKEGEIEHLVEPDYHGDPINDQGCLSFYTFGWELLDEMKKMGFVNIYAVNYWSDEYGYLGEEQISFVAQKPRASLWAKLIDKVTNMIRSYSNK